MSVPTRTVPVPASVVLVADRVERRLAATLDREIERWGALDDDLVLPLRELRRFVIDSGKRLRPAFCYWGFVGSGGDLHDDVMDGSAMRRGARTVHLQFADGHDRSAWRGEPRRFGEGVAILIGDLAHVYADR